MRNSSGLESKLLCGHPSTSHHFFAKWLCTGEICTWTSLTVSVKMRCPGSHIWPTEPAVGGRQVSVLLKPTLSCGEVHCWFRSTAYSLPPRDTAEVESYQGWDFIPRVIRQMSECSSGQFCKFKLDIQTRQVIWSEPSGFFSPRM